MVSSFVRGCVSTLCASFFVATGLFAAPEGRLARLPIGFEPNQGQTGARVRFLSRGSGYSLLLLDGEIVMRGQQGEMRMGMAGARSGAPMEGLDRQPGVSHYFTGNDRARWWRNVPHYGKVAVRGLYPGIDAVYYGKGRRLEYDFIVAPGADPGQIRMRWSGAGRVRVGDNGDLVLGELRIEKPVVYQEVKGQRRKVEGGYRVGKDGVVSFALGRYDKSKTLVIDPVIVFGTYLGGTGVDASKAIAVDGGLNTYLAGYTTSLDFPIVGISYAAKNSGNEDVFVVKLDPTGSQLLFSTYLGGGNNDRPVGIGVDPQGNVMVAGRTGSDDFPRVGGLAGQGTGIFVAKLNATGSQLMASTFFGGGQAGGGTVNAMAMDGMGNVYLAGVTYALNFPVTPGVVQGTANVNGEGFVAKLNNTLDQVVYSTYLGGSGYDQPNAMTVDGQGQVYLVGNTTSANFPVTANAYVSPNRGSIDGFVTVLNSTATALVSSSILGGSAEEYAYGVAIGPSGSIYVAGTTLSGNYPTTPGVFQVLRPSSPTAGFVTRLTPDSTGVVYSTYLGSAGSAYYDLRSIAGLAVDVNESLLVLGNGFGNGLPVTPNPIQPPAPGNQDGFLLRLNGTGDVVTYSTYLGGSAEDTFTGMAVDGFGSVYLTGYTESVNLPVSSAGVLQTAKSANTDAFLFKIDMGTLGSTCTATLSAGTLTTDFLGGTGSFDFTTAANCPWTVATTQNWITLSPPLTGTGPTTIGFTVAVNPGRASRSGAITIAGKTFTVNQGGAPCSYQVDPSSRTLSPVGGLGSFTVTTISGCAWTAASNSPWIRVVGGTAGNASGTVQYSFDDNTTGLPRTGSLTIAGQGIQVLQQAPNQVQVFDDVPLSYPYFDYITLMKQNSITAGCGPTSFCPDAATTRSQMAVFIVRAKDGGDVFPYTTKPYFTDVPATHPHFPWVQRLRDLGITVGCSATTYCPDDPVTRGQMAVFLIRGRLKIKAGQTFPYVQTPYFTDVPPSHPYFSFVQKMRELGITVGCSATTYCPDDSTTRGQMSVFLIRGFFTP